MLAAFLLPLASQGPTTLELRDGAQIPGDFPYWSVADTYLDARAPAVNYGGAHVLRGGPNQTILIRFGDLDRVVGPNRKVVRATLYLTLSASAQPELSSIRRVTVPWGEGPLNTLLPSGKEERAAPFSATWRARRSGGEAIEWQQGGASGPSDGISIPEAKLQPDGDEIAVTGLETAVQAMVDRWYENHGFALTFATAADFASSESPRDRPRLVLELAPADSRTGPDLSVVLLEPDGGGRPRNGAEVVWKATVRNVGDAASQPFTAQWFVRERPGASFDVGKGLAPGESTTLEMRRGFRDQPYDHRQQPLGLRVRSVQDANASNDFLEVQESAIPIPFDVDGDGVQGAVRSLNEGVLAESKFSFAPEGVLIRYRAVKSTSGAVSFTPNLPLRFLPEFWGKSGLVWFDTMNIRADENRLPAAAGRTAFDRFPGAMAGGSTLRDEALPGSLALPHQPFSAPHLDAIVLEPSGLLSATDVAALNRLGATVPTEPIALKGLPAVTLIRVARMDGVPLSAVELSFYQSSDGVISDGSPTFTLTTGANGTVSLPNRNGDPFGGLKPDGSNGVYLVSATAFGTTDYAWLKAWHLVDAVARAGRPVALTELRFNLPSAPVDRGSNLAEGRLATNSVDDMPARLVALVDGQTSAAVELPNTMGAWVEIDLGRDRPIAEVVLRGPKEMWQRFDVLTYATGETASSATPLARELDWDWTYGSRAERTGDSQSVPYRGHARRGRYVRLVCFEPSAGKPALADIAVFGVATAP